MRTPPDAKHMAVTLRVIDVAKDETIRKLEFNYSNSRHRGKINKTMYWALNNGHAVELIQTKDDA